MSCINRPQTDVDNKSTFSPFIAVVVFLRTCLKSRAGTALCVYYTNTTVYKHTYLFRWLPERTLNSIKQQQYLCVVVEACSNDVTCKKLTDVPNNTHGDSDVTSSYHIYMSAMIWDKLSEAFTIVSSISQQEVISTRTHQEMR